MEVGEEQYLISHTSKHLALANYSQKWANLNRYSAITI
jgi:hypothetical protein